MGFLLIWMFFFSKIGGKTPQIIHFNRVFHYFHHPFWGTPIFGNTHMHVIFTNKDWYFRDILLRWSSIVTKWSHRIYLYWSPKRTELLKNQWFSNSGCPTDNKQHQVVGATFNSHSSLLGVMKWSPGPVPVLEQLDKPKQQSHSYVYNIMCIQD